MPVDFSVTNQLASPAIYASSFATRPAPSFNGRLFVDTDNPSTGIYRDTGTAWIAIASTSGGTITGTGTTGTITKFTGTSTIGNSIVSEIASALTINGTAKATNYYVGSPTDTTRAFAAGGNANDIALYLEEYGNTTSPPDVFMYKGRGTISAKLNVLVGDYVGSISTGGYINGNLINSASFVSEVVNVDTINNHADTDWVILQTYNSAGTTENFRIRSNDGFVVAPNGVLIGTSVNGGQKLQVAGMTFSGISYRNGTYTQGDTTPSVLGISFLTISNTLATTITNFTGATQNQIITLLFTDSNTTINRTNAYLFGGINFISTANDTLTLISDGVFWWEVSRSVNA